VPALALPPRVTRAGWSAFRRWYCRVGRWGRRGGRPPSLRPPRGRQEAFATWSSPSAAVVSGALAYLGALAIATPGNDYDTLWYHLSRAAFLAQQHAVGYVPHANDARLDVFPPGTEIVSAWAMALGGNERFAALFQLVGLVAMVLAIAGIARRLGLERRDAVFGAVLFASLPVVLLQASTALNDVALASFVVIAVHFLISDARAGLALGSLSLALAVATKPTALLALALLLVVAAVLTPPRRWLPVAVAGIAGIVVVGFWYAYNRAELGSFVPQFAPSHDAPIAAAEYVRIPAQLARMAIDAVDPAGAVGRDRYLYFIAAALVLGGALLAARARRSRMLRSSASSPPRSSVPRPIPRPPLELYQRVLDTPVRSGLRRSAPSGSMPRRRSCPGTAARLFAFWQASCRDARGAAIRLRRGRRAGARAPLYLLNRRSASLQRLHGRYPRPPLRSRRSPGPSVRVRPPPRRRSRS
jgi:hypothetical protein